MTIKSIQGDENIFLAMNAAKEATLMALVSEGYLSEEKANEFSEKYVAMLIDNRGFFKKFFIKQDPATHSKVLISKII